MPLLAMLGRGDNSRRRCMRKIERQLYVRNEEETPFDIKEYILEIQRLKIAMSSKDLADYLVEKGYKVSAATIAGYKGCYTKSQKSAKKN
jgi:hypothetical protein